VRVLVVDDCRSLANLVAEGLSDQGIATDVAYDGTEAAGKLALHSYDVVVLDRSLPGVPDDYLAKPFHFPELVMRVRALARRQPRAMPRVLRADGIELDCLARAARRDGMPLGLSAKELAVLEALMASSPAYLSAEQLLETAWDENADPFTKTVAVTIGRLRRKLGEPQVIETAIGVGYRIVGVRSLPFSENQLSSRRLGLA
jgi:DNA-binding response OmpR family regulator